MVGLPAKPPSQYGSPSISIAWNIVGRQAEASRHVGSDLCIAEDAATAGVNVGRGDEQLDRRPRQPLEIDALIENGGQRIDAARIEIVGREHPRYEIERDEDRRVIERPAAEHAVDRRALQRAERSGLGDPLPVGIERRACALRPRFRPTVGKYRGVHGAGRRSGNGIDPQPRLFEEPVEYAPREGTMGAAALKGEIDQQRLTFGLFARIGDRHRTFPVADPARPLIGTVQGNATP